MVHFMLILKSFSTFLFIKHLKLNPNERPTTIAAAIKNKIHDKLLNDQQHSALIINVNVIHS